MTHPDYTIELRFGDKRITVSAGVPHVVGRGQTDGLGIDDPQVSFRHLVVWFDQVWQVWSEGRNGSFVNGQAIQGISVTAPVTINLAGAKGAALQLIPAVPAAAAPQPEAWPQQQGWGQQPGWGQQQGWEQQQAWGQQPGWEQQQGWGEAQAYSSGSLPAVDQPAEAPAQPPPQPNRSRRPKPQPQAQAPVAPPAVASDLNASAIHPVMHGGVTVGRAPDNTIVLDHDLLVSRHHAELRYDGQYWVLTDLGSANGTYVDGRRITSERIWPNSLIGIGHQTYRLYNGTLVEFTDTGVGHLRGARADRHHRRGPQDPRQRELRARAQQHAGDHRAQRLGQVDAAQGADRHPAGHVRAGAATAAATCTPTTTRSATGSASCRRTTSCTRSCASSTP